MLDSGRMTGKPEVMPGTDSQRRWPEVGFEEIAHGSPPSPFVDNFRSAEQPGTTPFVETRAFPSTDLGQTSPTPLFWGCRPSPRAAELPAKAIVHPLSVQAAN